MRSGIQSVAAGGAFALYAAMGAAAFAQPTPAAAPAAHQHGMAAKGDDPAERASRLRDVLQLRPAQEPALQAYVSALRSAHQGMASEPAAPMPSTTPERLDRMQRMMAQHQAAMTAMIDATRRFYDQLDAGQKRAFDAMPPKTMMKHHHGMGGRDGHDMPPPPPPPPGR